MMRKTKLTTRVANGIMLNGKAPKRLSEAEQAEYDAWFKSEASMSGFEMFDNPEFTKLSKEFDAFLFKLKFNAAIAELSATEPIDLEALKKKIWAIIQ